MGTSHNGNDYERLKEELRRLKRRGAPWYFESELHQRLHERPGRTPRLRPISFSPVLAVAFLTLCILGIALYAVFMNTNIRFGGSPQSTLPDTARLRAPDSVIAHPAPAGPAGKRPAPGAEQRIAPSVHARQDTLPVRPPRIERSIRDTGSVKRDTSGVRKDSLLRKADTTGIPEGGAPPR
jgi:hypothetical protein